MSVIFFGVILTLTSFTASHREYHPISNPCHVGDVFENDCNFCTCTHKRIFECDSKPCNKTENIVDTKIKSCRPNMLYLRNETVCLCKADGSWPHDKCKTIFKSFPSKLKNNCEPNSFVIIDCNVCKCGLDGKIDKNRCTKYECQTSHVNKSRRYSDQNHVYGSCEAKNWYSLAPCQFCYCISKNKLVCNTGDNYSKKIQLGSYNLSICGTNLIKGAMDLVPKTEKAMRFQKVSSRTPEPPDTLEKTTMKINQASIELNRESNVPQEIIVKHLDRYEKNSDEYESESEEYKVRKPILDKYTNFQTTEVSQNSLTEDEIDSTDLNQPKPKPNDVVLLPSPPPISAYKKFPQHFEWTGPTSQNGELSSDAFDLKNVLKPYLPVVMDKVFQMALRKSMVSIDAHANCTPGATTVIKCNACFCMKNAKMLCTNNECD